MTLIRSGRTPQRFPCKRSLSLTSVEAIRAFRRCFADFQGHANFRHKWRRVLEQSTVLAANQTIEAAVASEGRLFDGVHARLFAALIDEGVHQVPACQAVPLEIEVSLQCQLELDFLELIEAIDRLIPLIEVLEDIRPCHQRDMGKLRAQLRRAARRPLSAARATTAQLRVQLIATGAMVRTGDSGSHTSIASGLPPPSTVSTS